MNNFSIRHFILTLTIIYCQTNVALAITTSTPDPQVQIFPNILINEVSFKDSSNDWIELYIVNDMNAGKGANIKGLKINDDTDFLKVINDFTVHSGDYLLINFKSETENLTDTGNLISFNIKRSGLTATTEQVIIKNSEDEIIDAVCWANSSPTETEISDFEEIAKINQWTQDINSCIKSDSVESGMAISRKNINDTNSSSDWLVTEGTKGASNIEATEENTTATPDPVITTNNTNYDDVEDEDEEEKIEIHESDKKETINTCKSIIINEFLPNPESSDTGNEWIELFNPDEDCIMDGWIIDDLEGGSKPFYIYNEKVLSNGFLLLPSWKTKINLNNAEDSVRLFTGVNDLKEKIDYTNAEENISYAKNTENQFLWTENLTPLGKNIFSNNDAESEEVEEDEEVKTITTKKKTTINSKTIVSGDLSDEIQITEIFPNPKGTDKGNEWVEIYNNSDGNINLGGWVLDTGESSTKKYIFDKTTIKSKEYLALTDSDLGLSLKNTDGEVRLLDYEEKLIDSTSYESAAENSSFMKINIINVDGEEFEWKWTAKTTKGDQNQTLYKYKGVITLLDEKNGNIELSVEEKNEKISAKLVQGGDNSFVEDIALNAEVEMVFSKTENNEFIVEDFQILSKSPQNGSNDTSGIIYLILSSLPPAGVLGYFGLKKLGLIKFIAS